MSSPLAPSAKLLVTLGSIAVLAKEVVEAPIAYPDVAPLGALLADPDLAVWLEQMERLHALPATR